MKYTQFDSALGEVTLTGNGHALTGFYFASQKYHPAAGDDWQRDDRDPVLEASRDQYLAYETGRLREFDLPLEPVGTPFQLAVWRELLAVAYSQTITYAELSRRVGRPRAVRAVGASVGRNPISVIVPCHRIVGSNGSLTGYAGGLERKRRLLTLEGALLL